MAKITSKKNQPSVGRPKKTLMKVKEAKEATGKVKKSIKTAQNISDVQDTSLSPVVIKNSKQVTKQQIDNVEATKTGRTSRNAKTNVSPMEPSKSVEQVLDIREIKKQAQKIIQEKQNKALGGKLRVSPRKKENVNTPLMNAAQNRRNKGKSKVIETISDGPTVSLLSQNKIIQKNLPKPLRHVQKQLLKETKSKKGTKKSALLKKNDNVKNQKIIQKLTKVLLKNKVLSKAQLNGLVQNKSDFKAIAALVGLLKGKRKSVGDDKKNEWRVCSKEEEEEVEEDAYEMEDDEDEDKDYLPPAEDQARKSTLFNNSLTANTSATPKQRMITPLKSSSNVKSNKNYTPTGYLSKPNRLASGDMPLYPIDNIKKMVKGDKAVISPAVLGKKSNNREANNQEITLFMETNEDVQDESIHSINALLKQTENLTPQYPATQKTPSGKQQDRNCTEEYYCQVCFKTYKNKANLMKHKETWLHKFQLNASAHNTSQAGNDARTDKMDSRLISQIKQEMVKNMSQQIELAGKKDASLLSPNTSSVNIGSKYKYILDTELNLSLVVDSLNLILTNDVEDDEDAYDTLQMAI
ncbi:hypothetical protein WDU94_003059, partial [Cyamophila willieti]